MFGQKKERLLVSDLLPDPAMTYPTYYSVSKSLHQDEILHDALIAIHSYNLKHYEKLDQAKDIFAVISRGGFAIYKEQYVVGFYGGKLMYLEPSGWKGLQATEDIFDMENWLG